MRSLLIVILLSKALICEGQKKTQPQFIEFVEEAAHPEIELAHYPPLYISTTELDLPLPSHLAKIVQQLQKSKPAKSAKEIDTIKEFYLGECYWREITDKKSFDLLHDYILRNRHLLLTMKHRPDCQIVIDNNRLYLPERNMNEFYRGLKAELLLKKCDIGLLNKIDAQFTTEVK
jgi:pterin-4a-carbinolamine dehydratase